MIHWYLDIFQIFSGFMIPHNNSLISNIFPKYHRLLDNHYPISAWYRSHQEKHAHNIGTIFHTFKNFIPQLLIRQLVDISVPYAFSAWDTQVTRSSSTETSFTSTSRSDTSRTEGDRLDGVGEGRNSTLKNFDIHLMVN